MALPFEPFRVYVCHKTTAATTKECNLFLCFFFLCFFLCWLKTIKRRKYVKIPLQITHVVGGWAKIPSDPHTMLSLPARDIIALLVFCLLAVCARKLKLLLFIFIFFFALCWVFIASGHFCWLGQWRYVYTYVYCYIISAAAARDSVEDFHKTSSKLQCNFLLTQKNLN